MKRRQMRLQGDKWQAVLVWDDPDPVDFQLPMDPNSKMPERYVLFGPPGEGATLARVEAHEIPWLMNALANMYPPSGGNLALNRQLACIHGSLP